MAQVIPQAFETFWRRFADLLLFCVTLIELVILFLLTSTFTITDWIYVLQHFIVLVIAVTRPHPKMRDYSIVSSMAVATAYAYPYAQVIYLRWSPGHVTWPAAGLVLVTLAAGLSLVSLLALRSNFGIRPALRNLVTSGPYRFVRHPMYLSYVLADIGYNLQEWNSVTLLFVIIYLTHQSRGRSYVLAVTGRSRLLGRAVARFVARNVVSYSSQQGIGSYTCATSNTASYYWASEKGNGL